MAKKEKTGRVLFKAGQSGNPKGRPKGSRNKATLLARKMMENDLDEIVSQVIEKAKSGDFECQKLILSRLLPQVKNYPLDIKIPEINSPNDLKKAFNIINKALGSGKIDLDQAEKWSNILKIVKDATLLDELEERLLALENKKTK
ncbi:MAG: hypothetical protein HN921_15645 [Bacteroidetes bacterium]|nr:hypothetical protein [Bacteroidota bacterium]